MRIAIDAAGRVVIPKPLREELGLDGPGELELTAADGHLELAVPDLAARIEERQGLPVIVADPKPPPLTAEQVRATLERVRR